MKLSPDAPGAALRLARRSFAALRNENCFGGFFVSGLGLPMSGKAVAVGFGMNYNKSSQISENVDQQKLLSIQEVPRWVVAQEKTASLQLV